MKEITNIFIISDSATDIVNYIEGKSFDTFFDLRVGDKIAYNTRLYIYNEKYVITGIEGVIVDITNFLDTNSHIKSIAIDVDYNLLKKIKNIRNRERKLCETINSTNTEIVEQNSETRDDAIQDIKDNNAIDFE